jgi:hypothetical protein
MIHGSRGSWNGGWQPGFCHLMCGLSKHNDTDYHSLVHTGVEEMHIGSHGNQQHYSAIGSEPKFYARNYGTG